LKGDRGGLAQSIDNDRSIIATDLVCRNWRDNLVLREERREAAPRLHLSQERLITDEYPQEMVQSFLAGNVPIPRMPILDVRGLDNIADIQPEDMTDPVMRFQDQHGRPGIALKIQARRGFHFPRYPLVRGDTIVLSIFKRYSDPESGLWVYGWGGSDSRIENVIVRMHNENEHEGEMPAGACPTCPLGTLSRIYPILPSLLGDEDPDFRIPRNNI